MVVAALPAAPVAGLRVSPVPVPNWVTAACAWVVPSTRTTHDKRTDTSDGRRSFEPLAGSRYTFHGRVPFHFLVIGARRLACPLAGCPRGTEIPRGAEPWMPARTLRVRAGPRTPGELAGEPG